MIIEFELEGSKCLHKGIFDTTGFWVKYSEDRDREDLDVDGNYIPSSINGYKIFSHFSFSYYHTDKTIVDLVYSKLLSVLRGSNGIEMEGIGFIRKLNK